MCVKKKSRPNLFCFSFLSFLLKDLVIFFVNGEFMENKHFKLITIEISGACNAHCPFCVTGRGDIKPGKMMSLDLFKKTIHRLKDLDLVAQDCAFILYNWGEPFLNPEINEILEFCNDEKLCIHLSTNASTYKKLSKKAIQAINHIVISMPGFSQTAYDKIHGFDFEKIKENIELFTLDFKKYSTPQKIQLRQHIYQWNLDDIAKTTKFAFDLGVDFYPYYAYIANYEMFKKYKLGQLDKQTEHEINTNLFTYYLHNYENKPDFVCPQFDYLIIDESANVVGCDNLSKDCNKFVLFNIFDDNALDRMNERINMEECKTCVETGIAQITHSGISTMPDWADKLKNYEWKLEKFFKR